MAEQLAHENDLLLDQHDRRRIGALQEIEVCLEACLDPTENRYILLGKWKAHGFTRS